MAITAAELVAKVSETGAEETAQKLGKVNTTLEQTPKSAGLAGQAFSGLTSHLGTLVTAAVGVGAIFEGRKLFGDSVQAAESLASSVKKLQIVTGDTAENSSRLLAAFKESGVGGEEAERSVIRFSKSLQGLIENEDGTTTKSSAVIDKLKDIGVSATDAAGKTMPINDVMLTLADRFHAMGPGAESTALALQLFGKSGADMLPFLLKGRDGVAELEKQSDKFGTTINQKTLDSVKRLTLAHREYDAAIEGTKVQLGIALLPIATKSAETLTKLAVGFNSVLVPAIRAGVGVFTSLSQVLAKNLPNLTALQAVVFTLTEGHARLRAIALPVAEAFDTITQKAATLAGMLRDELATAITTRVLPALSSAVSIFESMSGGVLSTTIEAVQLLISHWDQLTTRFPILGAAVETAAIVWYQQLLPALQRFGDFAQQRILPALAEMIPPLESLGQSLQHTLGDALQQVAPLVERFFSLMDNRGALILAGVGVAALAVALGPVITGVAAASVGIALLYTHFGEISGAVASFADTVNQRFPEVGKFIDQATYAFTGLTTFITEQFWPRVQAALSAVVDWISSNWATIESLLRGPFEIARGVIEGILVGIKDVVNTQFVAIGDVLQIFGDLFRGNWGKLWGDVKSLVTDTLGNLRTLVSDQFNAIADIAKGVWDTISTTATAAWDALVKIVNDRLGDMLTAIKGIPGQIASAIGDLSHLLYQNGVDLVQGFINGIVDTAKDIPGTVAQFGRDALGALNPFGHSPWPGMEKHGRDAGQGFINGLTAMLPVATATAAQYGSAVLGALDIARLLRQAGAADPSTITQLTAIALAESSGNPNARNPSGAAGLFQFMPGTAQMVGLQNPYDPAQAAAAALRLLPIQGYNAWEAHTVGTDRQFLGQASSAAQQVLGDPGVIAAITTAAAAAAASPAVVAASKYGGGGAGLGGGGAPQAPPADDAVRDMVRFIANVGAALGGTGLSPTQLGAFSQFAQRAGTATGETERSTQHPSTSAAGLGGDSPAEIAARLAAGAMSEAGNKLDISGKLLQQSGGSLTQAAGSLKGAGDLLHRVSGSGLQPAGDNLKLAGDALLGSAAQTTKAAGEVERLGKESGEKLVKAGTSLNQAADKLKDYDPGAVARGTPPQSGSGSAIAGGDAANDAANHAIGFRNAVTGEIVVGVGPLGVGGFYGVGTGNQGQTTFAGVGGGGPGRGGDIVINIGGENLARITSQQLYQAQRGRPVNV